VGEVGEDHGGETHAGEDGDVDLGMAEEPEEMEPEEGRAVAAMLEEDAVDQVLCGKEEAAVKVSVAEEEKECGEEDGEGEDAEEGGGEPSPDGEGEALPGHALAAQIEDGGKGVDGSDGGGDGEDGDAGKPEIHPEALTGTGECGLGEWRIGCPATDGGSAGDEKGGEQRDKGGGSEPHTSGVEARKGHVAGANLGGENEVAEARLWSDGEDEEQHERTVHGDDCEVLFREDGAVERELPVGPCEMHPHGKREQRADDDRQERDEEIAEAYGAVVGEANPPMSQRVRHEWGTRIGGRHGLTS